MAGLGFNAGKGAPRKPMGIQFVKSAETVGRPQNVSVPSESATTDTSEGRTNHGACSSNSDAIPSLMSSQITPTLSSAGANANFDKTSSSAYGHMFVKSGETYSSLRPNSSGPGQGYRMPGQANLNKGGVKSSGTVQANAFQRVTEAKPVCSVQEYLTAWKQETDKDIARLRKLAYEVITLKSNRPNAKDKLHSAANRVPVRIEFNTQPVFGAKNNNSFLCYVYMEGVSIASGQGPKIKDAKTNAYERALQKILMPHLRIISVSPTEKELQVSKEPFTAPPPQPSKVPLNINQSALPKDAGKEVASQHKESNMEAAGLKRRYNEYKPLDEFVIVEPKVPIQDCTAAHTLRRSADFNHMLLEYEYFFKGEAARCILRIENEILADVSGISKAAAKNTASAQALLKLKKFCWIIKTKQAVDSNTKISKEEMLNELNDTSDGISHDNIGNKLLRKMGWSGGGVGKDGSGIAEPVSLKSVLNREGLGLSATKGVTDEFRRKVKEVIENYAASNNQEDLVFSCDFRLEERQIIHDECRRLNLRSKSKGKGQKRYLCVRRKRSVNQLFDHLMSVGGETARYQLVPPGRDLTDSVPNTNCNNKSAGHPSSQLGEASVKPQVPSSGSNSDCANGMAPPFIQQESKRFVPQKGSSPNPHNTTPTAASVGACQSNVYSGFEGKTPGNGQQGGSSPSPRNNFPSFGYNSNPVSGKDKSHARPGSLANSPTQNKFPRNYGGPSGDHNMQNNGLHFQPSVSMRVPISSVRDSVHGLGLQCDADMDFRPSTMNNLGGTSHNVTNNRNMMYPGRNNSPFFRPMGLNFQDQGPPPTRTNPDGFSQNVTGPPSFNQRTNSHFQGHQNSMSAARIGFNNRGNGGMPMGRNPNSEPFWEMAPGMSDSGWNGPEGYHDVNREGGMGYNRREAMEYDGRATHGGRGTMEMNLNPNHYMQQQLRGIGTGNFNLNPNMMGGYR